ncbi:MAG: (2Fe-2S)-binding protein, partial [Bosea sp. (in: a-proteobacteria)]
PARLGAAMRMAVADPVLTTAGLTLMGKAWRSGTRLRFGQVARSIKQVDAALEVEIGAVAGTGDGERFTVDVVALGYGFQPSNELLRAMGAAHIYDPVSQVLRTVRSEDGETSVANVFAVGDASGPGGAPVAQEEGLLAGLAVVHRVRSQQLAPSSSSSALQLADASAARRRLKRHQRFQAALWQLYAAPQIGLSLANDETLVCRCEDVSKGDLMLAMADGEPSIAEIKRRTRAGMGRCQGRYCSHLIAAHLAAETGRPLDERALFAPRAPVKPVTIADMVGRPPL